MNIDWKLLFENLKQVEPTVHCITNFVTVNDCANMVLAAYGKPTMAHHPGEVEEITSRCQALVLNMGTLHDVDSMLLAGKRSAALGHPVILDPVGVGGSTLRKETFLTLYENISLSVIRGNRSEIKAVEALVSGNRSENRTVEARAAGRVAVSKEREHSTPGGVSADKGEFSAPVGVDADAGDAITEENVRNTARLICRTAKRTGSIIAVSGAIDIVAGEDAAFLIRNGHPIMTRVTGTGCMLTALIGTFCGANPDHVFEATAAAVAAMGVAGERAWKKTEEAGGGTMTFRMHLIDEISLMIPEILEQQARVEFVEL